MARATPSWAICATFVACAFVRRAFVTTTPIVVFWPAGGAGSTFARNNTLASATALGTLGAFSAGVLDDYTITFFYRRPGGVPSWDVYFPKHLLEDLDPAGFLSWEFWAQPVGNGPYRYARHDPETHMELVANADYYLGEPPIERVRFTLGSATSRLIDLMAGKAHIARLPPQEAEQFLDDERYVVHYSDVNSSAPVRLVWNLRHPLFEEQSVRQALTLAIDRRELARALAIPVDAPRTDGTYSGCRIERGELEPPWPYDPERARGILASAGWDDSGDDGVLDKDGAPFRFEALVVQDAERAAVFAQDQLRAVGIQMDVSVMNSGVVNQRFRAGEFDAAIPAIAALDRVLGNPRPSDVTGPLDSPTGFAHRRVRELWQRLRDTDSVDESNAIHRELSAIYHEEIPGTFLYSRVQATVARSWIRGVETTPYWTAFPNLLSIAEDR